MTILILVILMSAFAHFRNSKRLVGKIEVNFESHGARFLNDSLVDKLLIQNKGELPWKAKDSLVLSMLESLLEDNPYIDKAEVFHFHQGVLGVNILEKIAVLRVQGQDQFYLDRFGNQFPLSNNHTPKVPLYLGKFRENQKKDLLSLINLIDKDPDVDTEGYTVGLGYQHEMDNGLAIRLEATAAQYDDVSVSSSTPDSTETTAKKIDMRDMMSARGTISIVKTF